MNNVDLIRPYCDGILTYKQIAEKVGLSPSGVKKICLRHDLPRRSRGAMEGENNHQWNGGRHIDWDGYVTVPAPLNHPYSRLRHDRHRGRIFEHRLIMEGVLGRYLEPQEVVDHIDGLTLHNHQDNLRVFPDNAEHLRSTLLGKKKLFSQAGRQNIGKRTDLGQEIEPVDTHRLRRERGDVRLIQILRCLLQLGKDSPYLLGSSHLLEPLQIDLSDNHMIERKLAYLYQK